MCLDTLTRGEQGDGGHPCREDLPWRSPRVTGSRSILTFRPLWTLWANVYGTPKVCVCVCVCMCVCVCVCVCVCLCVTKEEDMLTQIMRLYSLQFESCME